MAAKFTRAVRLNDRAGRLVHTQWLYSQREADRYVEHVRACDPTLRTTVLSGGFLSL